MSGKPVSTSSATTHIYVVPCPTYICHTSRT